MKKRYLLIMLLSSIAFGQTHVLQPSQGGSGVSNTATFKMGSANWDLSAFAGGVPKISGSGVGAISQAGYADIVAMWASGSCSGFLKNDGTCGSGGGGGGGGEPIITKTGNYTVTTSDFSSSARILGSSATAITFTLVASGSQPTNGQKIEVENTGAPGTGALIQIMPSGQNLNGSNAQPLSVYPGEEALIVSDGTDYRGYLRPSRGDDTGQIIALGLRYDFLNPLGLRNTLIGPGVAGATGTDNVLIGYAADYANSPGTDNTDIGSDVVTGGCYACVGDTIIGSHAGTNSNGHQTIIGYHVGDSNYSDTYSVLIGTSNGIQGNSSHTHNYLDVGGQHTLIFGDMANGLFGLAGPSVAVTACGSGHSLNSGGNNSGGIVTVGSSSGNNCEVDFSTPYNADPVCNVTSQAGVAGFGYTHTAAHIIVTSTGSLDGTLFDYSCHEVSSSDNAVP